VTLGVGILGFGVLGRTHAAAFEHARLAGWPVAVRGVCATRPAGRPTDVGNLAAMAGAGPGLDPATVRFHEHHRTLLADPAIDAVCIATWTETHVPLALAALAAGKHVLVEKPVALATPEIERLAAAVPADRTCMPAFCMRFWPGWPWLRDRIHDGSLGRLRSLHLRRIGEPPGWSREFYGDPARSGGALFDLHVHDADFVRWCFGDPAGVTSAGTRSHLTTSYAYPGGPAQVIAEGGHIPVAGFGFRMQYLATFEEAVADFDHAREHPVLLTRGGTTSPVELPRETAYELQARHFVEQCLGTGAEPPRATMADAVAVTRLLEQEAGQVAR